MTQEELKEKKEKVLQVIRDPAYVPMKLKEMAVLLDVPKSRRDELKEVLDALAKEGKIGISAKGKYGDPQMGAVAGIFSGTSRGFGFVTVEGRDGDIFISEEKTESALHGDRVLVVTEREPGKGRRTEGRVLKILERANEEIVGFYQKNKNFGFVVPDNQRISRDIFIPQGCDMGAVTGHKVVVRIKDFGGNGKNPEGRITEILGHVNDPGTDILSIVRGFNLPCQFPEEVMEEVERIPDSVSEEETKGRMDFRDLPTVTIDGEDAKDLDDAITLSKEDGIYTLGVHIADVSHYVTENSLLDREARKRGTSVYLVDRVIPMLPHRLSNGICSLNQGQDRLTLSCVMKIDESGNVIDHVIGPGVIQVNRRMTYTAVNAIVTDEDQETAKAYEELVPMFFLMKELAHILRTKRKQRGSIDFDFPETKVMLDEKGRPVEIKPYERNTATKIIEDFMLIANETVAEDYYWQQIPFLFRTHDNPDPEKMKGLAAFIGSFGYTIRFHNGEIYPKEVQKLLVKAEDTPEEGLISRLALRSMKQAKYTVENTGHFGLAAKYYTHFTSPIRRYPDLQIHRIIKENLKGGMKEKRVRHYEKLLPSVAAETSALERRADEAERETVKLKKCEYMSRHIGEEYEGVISGITSWGIYVELPSTVEGFIRITELGDDYYIFDETSYELHGEMTGKLYKLGQTIRIQVAGVDRQARTIDFIPARLLGQEP